jgi:hypothetical protein
MYNYMDRKVLDMLALILVIIGGLNWGLVGALETDLVAMLLGTGAAAKAVYILVGLAAVYSITILMEKMK